MAKVYPEIPEETQKKIKELSLLLSGAKTVEGRAKENRIEVEEALALLIECDEEAQRSVVVGDYKVTVKRGLSYKVDAVGIRELCLEHSTNVLLKSSVTWSLDVAGYKSVKKDDPEFFAFLTQHVEVKPKKTAVTVKFGEEK